MTFSPGLACGSVKLSCHPLQVKKIFESERRLHAGDHSVELLAQDFEKNYNMYIYPVHWQFAQLDQHPSDRHAPPPLHQRLDRLTSDSVQTAPFESTFSGFFLTGYGTYIST